MSTLVVFGEVSNVRLDRLTSLTSVVESTANVETDNDDNDDDSAAGGIIVTVIDDGDGDGDDVEVTDADVVRFKFSSPTV
jgi:hypothetical protein